MKRTIFTCISFFLVSLITFSQIATESTWDNSDLKGRIRTITETNYIIDNGRKSTFSNKDIIIQDEVIKNFDRSGILMDQSLISYVGGKSKKWNFTYNIQRQLVEESIYDNSGSLDEIISYFYNGNKLVRKSFFLGPNKMLQKSWFYEYNVSGKLINEYWTDAQGKTAWRAVNVYDQAGNLVEKSWYVNEQLTTKWVCKYNVRGNIIENSEFVNGLLQSSEFNSYNDKGQLTESKVFKNSQLDIRKVYEYNKKEDLRMEWWYDTSGKQIHRRNYDYDKMRRMISTFTWDSDSRLLDKIHWAFDNEGNWVQRIEYERHVPVFTVKRSISYY